MRQFPLRVLMIGPTAYGRDDCDHSTVTIWRELAKGFEQLKVFARARGPGNNWRRDGVEVELIRGFFRRELEFLVSQFALVKRGRTYRPDVVVSQGVALGGWAAIRIAQDCRAATVIEVHSDDFLKRAPLMSKQGFLQRISGPVFARASLIRVLSDRMGEALVGMYGEDLREKIRVLPPRVDTKRFQPPVRRKSANGRLDLAIVGALNENKGQLRLIRELEAAHVPVTLHVFGDGPDHEAIAKAAARISGGPVEVVFNGLVTHSHLAEALGSCDALVMYSRREGTPRAIMEAMAMGLPVLTTDAGFCADIVEDGREGIILSNDRKLKLELESLLANPSRLARMGQAALQRARDQFAADKLYPRYRELIAEAAGL